MRKDVLSTALCGGSDATSEIHRDIMSSNVTDMLSVSLCYIF